MTAVSDGGVAGDLAVLFDQRRRFQGIGLYDPASPIRVRVLHHGQPAEINRNWWRGLFAAALERRRPLLDSRETTGVRCVHGENDGLPGLVVDRYDTTAVLKVYTPAWFPHLNTVSGVLDELLEPTRTVLRLSRRVRREAAGSEWGDGAVLAGDVPDGPVQFRENGLSVEADVVSGHKTGYFLDQRDNRRLVGSMCRGARILDVFSSSGGFSLAAAAGGAASVLSVDRSAPALASARRTFRLNRHRPAVRRCRHDTMAGDAFEVLADLAAERREFDVVVVDPPSFVANRGDVRPALGAYARLAALAAPLVAEGGLYFQASCSTHIDEGELFATVNQAVARVGRGLEELRRTGHPLDHPIGFPEGAYLKASLTRVWRH